MTSRALIFLCCFSCLNLTSNAQSTATFGSVNGVLNPTQYAGSDIGAQVNTAWKSGRTVRIPSGNYTYNTTIAHPGDGYKLECDAGTVLNYTGSGDAITLSNNNADGGQNAGIDGGGGCLLLGNSNAQSGIHIFPSNHTFVRNMRVQGFTNANQGYGIYVTGGNSVEINNVGIHGNRTGIFTTGVTLYGGNYAANGVHIEDSDISQNLALGYNSDNGPCSCTQNLGNVIKTSVFEGNAKGDIRINWNLGMTISDNYFESPGVAITLGDTQNVYGLSVTHNYFTSGANTPSVVTIGYGIGFNVEENSTLFATSSGCFINVVTGQNGISGGSYAKRGVGTNIVADKNEWCVRGTGTTTP